MRIIQAGKLPIDEHEQRSECRTCGTIFGWFPKEVKFVHDVRDGDYYDMECPFCTARVTHAAPLVRSPTPMSNQT